MLVVAGLAGSGKTETGKLLSGLTGWALLDKDTLTRPLVESLLLRLAGDPHDRHSPVYAEGVRPLEYSCLMKAGWENLACGTSVILSAPFIREVNDAAWIRRTRRRCQRFGVELRVVWVASDADTMRMRLVSRGAERDMWKLANWDDYLSDVDPEMLPSCPHFVIDNRIDAQFPLADQVASLVRSLEVRACAE
ncbi:ATP-binding protein [Actinomadura craniellae]|uniref:ATP-binding protein n=2 Tax=Actinomadura craniellae TaxID=2231787 RepID=A0A365HAA6_9ACTN|nr:ATP-binding protein [Actinomadura craniellae]